MGQRDTISGTDKCDGFIEALSITSTDHGVYKLGFISGPDRKVRLRKVRFKRHEVNWYAEEWVAKEIRYDDRYHYKVDIAIYKEGKRPELRTEVIEGD
jgi:hypothetical protein